MTHTRAGLLANLSLGILCMAAFLTPARADDGLKTIDNPGGGQVLYGALPDESSLQGAMGTMLRNIHGHFGDRPQVGKFFQTRGSDSIAAFFTLTAKKQGGKPIAGLVIVSLPQGSKPAAAVLYDDAARFTKTEPVMMQKLNEAWHAAAIRPAASAPTGSASTIAPRQMAPEPLHMATAGDRSASIGLPAGWQLTSVSGGQLTAEGPNGERVFLGIICQQIHDPRSMQNQQMPNSGGMGRSPPLVCAYGGDLFSAFVSVNNQVRRNNQLPPGTYKLISSQNLPASQFEQQVIQAILEVDLHDGKGPRSGSVRIGAMATRGVPTWAMTVSGSNLPKTVADAEAPTMMAILHSYSQDGRVIAGETKAVIDNIHAVAAAAAKQAAASQAAGDARNAAFNAHMDDIDRYSKSFQNYQLDRSQIQDNDLNARGTASNGLAEALVKADPNRFQYVQTKDFLKGVDY
jgi:hypothetical protein